MRGWYFLANSIGLLLLWATSVVGDEDVRIPANSDMILYDPGWSNMTGNPGYQVAVNGSLYFMYYGSNFSIHYSPPTSAAQRSLFMWIDGKIPIDLISSADIAGVSSWNSSLKEYPVTLTTANHQIYLTTSNSDVIDPCILAGFEVHSSDGHITPSAFGMASMLYPDVNIVDSSSLSYNGDWMTDDESWFSHNKTLKTTTSVGASVSFTPPEIYSSIIVYGTAPVESTMVNISYSSGSPDDPSPISFLWNANLNYGGLNRSIVRAQVWTGRGDTPAIRVLNITLAQGTFAIDFIGVQYPSSAPSSSPNKGMAPGIVILTSLLSLCLALVLSFVGYRIWKRHKLKVNDEAASKLVSVSNDDEIVLDDVPRQGHSQPHQSPLLEERSWQAPPPVPSLHRRSLSQVELQPAVEISHTVPSLDPHGSIQDTVQEHASSSQVNELPPAWSPPPPSYQTVSAMVTDHRAARGMMPLSQDLLERLFERVAELRRGENVRHDDLDEDLEALAQRIAGIETAPRIIKR
ncbi:hypothetical protein PIIN_08640 [Serendipita indica DSM 11827]|uniref:Uncharacterized protein n=1 Tax=Serendipita indica (strain DSM 11827) TaxID=1109443 RepID=G4TTP6_SERID|nr:hypothetical protein PIIN_08640 [Serendipita indica DSM 11827]